MANPQRGEADVVIDGKAYTLVMDLNACCEFESLMSTPAHPVPFSQAFQRFVEGYVNYMRGCVWAALRRHHKLSLDEVNTLIEEAGGVFGGGMKRFSDAIRDLVMPSLRPDAEDEAALQAARPIEAVPTPSSTAGTGRGSTEKRAKSA